MTAPSSPDFTARVTPTSAFVIFALAPAMTLPEGSLTVPTTAPLLCANVDPHSAAVTTITARKILKLQGIRILAGSLYFYKQPTELRACVKGYAIEAESFVWKNTKKKN